MSENPLEKKASPSELKSWLDKIQQDSWQLELIISGFVIFLLIGGITPIHEWENELTLLRTTSRAYLLLGILYYTLRTAYVALLVCLLLHVILRGIWIAAIGLRYVSGDIDYDALKYQDRYRIWLKGRIGSFDAYIERLERYCSVIFSVAFLIIFCFLSMASFFMMTMIVQVSFRWLSGNDWMGRNGVSLGDNLVGLLMLIMGIVYLIDFATLGFFKRNRFTAKPYFYFYRFMGWITLARLYRPLYHNLVDQRFGRRLARLLPLIIIGFLAVVSIKIIKYPYFPYYSNGGGAWIDHYNYDDEHPRLKGQHWRVTLNSKYPQNNYLEVFFPYRPIYQDEVIRRKFPDLEVGRYAGVKLSGAFVLGQRYNREADNDSLLIALSDGVELYLNDSLASEVEPRFHFHQEREQAGLLYMLPTHDLSVGEHNVRLRWQWIRNDSLKWNEGTNIYFYK